MSEQDVSEARGQAGNGLIPNKAGNGLTPNQAGDGPILGKAGDEPAFRQALREWARDAIARRAALDAAGPAGYEEAQRWWMAERNKVGLATPHWPRAYGGADLSLPNQVIVTDELARAGVPRLNMYLVALNHVPATLMAYGTPEQKAKHLPGVARGVVWCQGFSEPGAGSDLAALRTRAVRHGDHYVVNGQKIWSSYSMFADHCILLARTDPDAPRHKGITYFLMDMKSPGLEVRPIRQANGDAEFAELFLTDVRIPVENRVGEENQGWYVAQSTLSAERGVLSFDGAERFRYAIERYYAEAVARGEWWLDDPEMSREFVRLFGDLQASRLLLRQLLRENEEASPDAARTVIQVKMIYNNMRRMVGDFMVRAGGLAGQAFAELGEDLTPVPTFLSSYAGTIAGGSQEIMRNIYAERILGMPKG